MQLHIAADTAIRFDFDINHEGNSRQGTIQQDGGEWYINIDGAKEWLAGPRVTWPEVLKRALINLSAQIGRSL